MEALQAVAHQIKLIRKRMRKQQCKEEDMACLSARLSWQVVAVYVYSGNDLDVAAGFLQSKLPKNETHNMEDLRARVQRAYRSAPAAGVVALCHEAGVETHGAQPLVRACRYVVEARLYEWLLDQNCHRGVAPSRGQLVKFALSIVPEEPPSEVQRRAEKPLRGSGRVQRRWLQSFRKNWGAKLGTLQIVQPMPLHQKQEKAGWEFSFSITMCGPHFGVHFWGPKMGSALLVFFWGPHFGVHNSDPKTRSIFPLFFVKVVAFYRWLNGALNGSPKLPLIVNMDECSLAYHQTGIRGTVLRTQPLRSVRPEDRARLGDRRGNITYMASICNDPSFSNVLPQILLGNCQRFAKRVVEELKPSLPGNLFLWREKSAWNNRFQMRRYIKLLRQCLGDEVFQM